MSLVTAYLLPLLLPLPHHDEGISLLQRLLLVWCFLACGFVIALQIAQSWADPRPRWTVVDERNRSVFSSSCFSFSCPPSLFSPPVISLFPSLSFSLFPLGFHSRSVIPVFPTSTFPLSVGKAKKERDRGEARTQVPRRPGTLDTRPARRFVHFRVRSSGPGSIYLPLSPLLHTALALHSTTASLPVYQIPLRT